MTDRRDFLNKAFAATCIASLAHRPVYSRERSIENEAHPIAVFAKPLQGMAIDELGRRLKSIGVQGLEATLRKGGQIEPENLDEQLPKFCEALAKHDQLVIIATSDVNRADDAAERYVKTLAKSKVPFLRMAYYRYDFSRPLLPQLEKFAREAAEFGQLCEAHDVKALYQNHAGAEYVGAALWDLLEVLQHVASKQIAIAIDLCHTTHELSESWPAAYHAIRDRIGAVFVKDFEWVEGKATYVPLGEGRAQSLWKQLSRDGFLGPISLHMEHMDHRPAELLENRWRATAADIATLRNWL